MSTRCHIALYGTKPTTKTLNDYKVLLYRHCDGYPGAIKPDGALKDIGVLPDLVPFLFEFHKYRGLRDIEYAGAWLIHHLISRHVADIADVYKNNVVFSNANPAEKDGRDFLGHGICYNGPHGDIEYFYAVYPDLETPNTACVKVFGANLWDDKDLSKGLKALKTVTIDCSGAAPEVTVKRGK